MYSLKGRYTSHAFYDATKRRKHWLVVVLCHSFFFFLSVSVSVNFQMMEFEI